MAGLPDKEIDLADQAAIGPLLARRKAMFSESSFSNVFLFRHVHHYRFIGGSHPVIRGRTYDGANVAMPLFDLSTLSHADLAEVLGPAECFFPVMESDVAHLDPQERDLKWNEADSDYVYETARMAAFDGPLLKKRRSLAVRFERDARPVVRAYDASLYGDALSILDQWFADVEKPWAETDYQACREALEHCGVLGMFGLVCYDGAGDPAGFLLASTVREDTATVHFAKGKRKFDGVFPYMFNRFASGVGSGFTYLNFEQDLGNPGFRQAKKSYAPAFFLRKYRLYLA